MKNRQNLVTGSDKNVNINKAITVVVDNTKVLLKFNKVDDIIEGTTKKNHERIFYSSSKKQK